jgi:hypothetical protein
MALLGALGVLLGALLEKRLDVVVTVGVLYVGVIGLSGLESVILDAHQVVDNVVGGTVSGCHGLLLVWVCLLHVRERAKSGQRCRASRK